MRHHPRLMILAACASSATVAADIPLTVRVANGAQVQSVELQNESGLVALAKSPDGTSFTGNIAVIGGDTALQSIVVSYADFGYPVRLRVHQHLPRVEFPIKARLPASCTVSHVTNVEGQTIDLGTAISQSIQAARLASITGNDRCSSTLRARAVTAKFRNARRMAQLSKGLFVVPDELIAEYRALTGTMTAVAEIDRYEVEAFELQAVQLVALRDEAQTEGDFGKAAAIQQTIAQEASYSDKVEKAFANVGIDQESIEKDSAFLSSLAKEEIHAEVPN